MAEIGLLRQLGEKLVFLGIEFIMVMTKGASRILVVGANGYIGSNLSHQLLEHGYDVRLSDVADHSIISAESYVQANFEDIDQIRDLVKGVDYIYFFAGRTGNSEESFSRPDSFIIGNEVILVNLLNVLKELEVKPKVIFPSSRLIYKGNESSSIDEKSELDPKSVYAINKMACENYLKIYQKNYGIEYSIFRISLPYGSLIKQKRISYGFMSYLINQAEEGRELLIYGSGNQRGSLVHIEDLIEILIHGGMSDQTNNEIYNIGGPECLSIRSIVKLIAEKYQVTMREVEWPNISKNTDQGNLELDSYKINNLLDHNYKYQFSAWLNQIEL